MPASRLNHTKHTTVLIILCAATDKRPVNTVKPSLQAACKLRMLAPCLFI